MWIRVLVQEFRRNVGRISAVIREALIKLVSFSRIKTESIDNTRFSQKEATPLPMTLRIGNIVENIVVRIACFVEELAPHPSLKLTLSAIKAGYDKATRQYMVAATIPVGEILARSCQSLSHIFVHAISLMPLNDLILSVPLLQISKLGIAANVGYDQRSKNTRR